MKRSGGRNTTSGLTARSAADLGVQAIRAMRKAVRRARQLARLHGVPIHIWRDGKTVIDRP